VATQAQQVTHADWGEPRQQQQQHSTTTTTTTTTHLVDAAHTNSDVCSVNHTDGYRGVEHQCEGFG